MAEFSAKATLIGAVNVDSSHLIKPANGNYEYIGPNSVPKLEVSDDQLGDIVKVKPD